MVGNKNIGVKKKAQKSYAPKIMRSKLGMKRKDLS